MTPTPALKAFEKLGFMFSVKNWSKKHILSASVLPHDTHPFHSVGRKDVQCGESPTGGFW